MSYPVFSGSSFLTSTNQLTLNLNPNLNIPSPAISPFQPNGNMSFLSFPPPSLPGSHHVFQNGPRFPTASNTVQPGIFTANASESPGIVTPSSFPTSGNMVSPATFTSNIAALTSVPPPPISPLCTVTPFGLIQSQVFPNGAMNLANTGAINLANTVSFSDNFLQQTPQKLDAQSLNPWAFTPSNDIVNSAVSISPWAVDTPKASSSFNNFQSRTSRSNDNRSSRNSVSPWRSNSSNHSKKFSPTSPQAKKSPSKFRQSKSPACDINPWAQPPIFDSGSDNFQFLNDYRETNQQNFSSNTFEKPRYNQRRGHSRNFSNNRNKNNYQRQERYFKAESDFKREPAESKPYSCDTCDRACASEVELQDHMAEHIKCNFKNCQFEAHPKIVALHKKMQHDTGYADAINKLKNSDEIEKWRAERRRRFPTTANILKRKAEQSEKEARGEVIENKEFGKFKKHNLGQREARNNRYSHRKRSRNNRNNRFGSSSMVVKVTDSGSDSDDDSHIKLRKFCGLLAMENGNVLNTVANVQSSAEKLDEPLEKGILENSSTDYNLEDTEDKEELIDNNEEMERKYRKGFASSNPINIESSDDSPVEISIKGQLNNNADESDDEFPIEIPVSKVPLADTFKSSAVINKLSSIDAIKCYSDSDDDSPVEIPVSKVPTDVVSDTSSQIVKNMPPVAVKEEDKTKVGRNSSRNELRKRNSNNRKHEDQNNNPVRKSSLLEKLLADDIRHERNVIMQCIRHVVKNKFFGIGSSV